MQKQSAQSTLHNKKQQINKTLHPEEGVEQELEEYLLLISDQDELQFNSCLSGRENMSLDDDKIN